LKQKVYRNQRFGRPSRKPMLYDRRIGQQRNF
jgi:hypothetical protein